MVQSDDVRTHFKILKIFTNNFLKGTSSAKIKAARQRHTLPALFFAYLKLAYDFKDLEAQGEDSGMDWEKYFTQCRDVISPLTEYDPELTLKLYLQLQLTTDQCDVK